MEGKLKYSTFNCQGFKHRMYKYIKNKFKDCDVLLLQETWMYNFEHKMFSKIIPDCQYHAVSTMDEAEVRRLGRPYGGCAVLWKKNLAVSVTPISTTSPRICAVAIKSEHVKAIVISVYMPSDDNSNSSYDIYGDVLYELSSIVGEYDDHEFIIGGDFNVDFNRINSRNLTLLKQFLQLEDLECKTLNILKDNFTRSDVNSRAFLDHFILSNNVDYSNLEVLYDGDNLSDHNPVTIQTNQRVNITKPSSCRHRFIKWENATEENIRNG